MLCSFCSPRQCTQVFLELVPKTDPTFVFLQTGGELGSSSMMSGTLQKVFLYGMPLTTLVFMLFMPACLQLTFAFTSMVALLQGRLLRYPPARKFLGISPLPQKPKPGANPSSPYKGTLNRYQPPTPMPAEKKGLLGGAISELKGAASGVMKSAKTSMEEKKPKTRLTEGELRKAKAYEERRRREIEQEKYEAAERRKERSREKKRA